MTYFHQHMTTSRRTFLKHLGLLSAGVAAGAAWPQMEEPLPPADAPQYWQKLRKQWPLQPERAYMNNGTIGPSPYAVQRVVMEQMQEMNRTGEYSGWHEAVPAIAAFIGAEAEEIALTHNTTEGINIVAQGLRLQEGDEVIMTTHEHAGNALPWLNRARRTGIVLRPFVPAPTAAENLERIRKLITPQTRVVAVPHITCTTGLALPVREIAKLCREQGLYSFIDGAQSVGNTVVDVMALGVDFYATCGHKWMCGPEGTGYLYIRNELLEEVEPLFIGTYTDTGWSLNREAQHIDSFVDTAHRYYYGTQNAALYMGVAAAAEFLQEVGMPRVEERTRQLAQRLQEGLLETGKVEMLSPLEPQSRGPMITFRAKDLVYRDFGQRASDATFRLRMVPEAELDAIRVSTHIYNSEEEVDALVRLVAEA